MKRRNGAGKQNWRTPRFVFEAIERFLQVTFDVDGAADWDGGNSLCIRWMADCRDCRPNPPVGLVGDALIYPWPANANIFINPPFANILPWVEAIERNRPHVGVIALLVPAATETEWFRKCASLNATCWFLYPRVAYIDPDGEKKVSPPQGSCVWVFSRGQALITKPSYYHVEIRKP